MQSERKNAHLKVVELTPSTALMHRMRRWLALSLLMVFICPPANADENRPPSASEAWHVDADRIEFDQVNQAYIAQGNVRIEQTGYTLTADRVRLNRKTRLALAEGNVRLVSGQDVLSGRRLQLDTESETGTLTDGGIFISRNHLYLTGKEIQKTGPHTYSAKKVSITSCDGDDPAWKVTGSDFKVTIEGYGTAKHTALWAGKVPVLYSPYLIFPVKLKRQSGLLLPEIGYSDRLGNQYNQPFFWAINESSDATLYAHTMSERGVRTGIEYRYVLSQNTMGTVMVEGFNDQKVDDGTGDTTERWGYSDGDDLRTNEDRYWVRMKHDHGFDNGLSAKLDIDVVSDQDYLHEFKTGYYGFTKTRDYFQKTFGREIDDYNDAIRLNRFNLNKTWDRYTFNTDLRWYDNVVNRRNDETNNTLQQLPEISFDGVKQQTGKSPFYHDLTSSYTHFYRMDGPRAHRADIHPRIYYPFDLFGALSIEPSAGVRQTAWWVDFDELGPESESESHNRTIYDLKLDVSTEFYRIFDFGLAGCDRLKHALTPEIIYEYIPEQDQTDWPKFDALDRIAAKNLITYGINNTFTARAPRRAADQAETYTYTPFLRFKLSQSFDINEAEENEENDPEPFSNIKAELDLTPGKYISIDADAQWSVYDDRFEAINSAVNLWSTRGDRLTVDYRYTRESDDTDDKVVEGIETIRLDGVGLINDRWRVRAGLEHNRLDDQLRDSNMGLSYQSQCWGVDFDYKVEYTDTKDNHSFTVMFNLLGLGSLGN